MRLRESLIDAPSSPPDAVFDHVYATTVPHLVRQRRQLRQEIGAR